MIDKTGIILSKAFLSPPIKIEILPVAALWHPPLTGASSGIAPLDLTIFPILLTSDNGLQVKAKGLKLTTITLQEFLNQLKRR